MNIVTLRHSSGASAQISEYGAHILSWKACDGIERLFLSERAEFKPGVAIRGGVPIIFPQFAGLGALPKHGFARTSHWEIASTTDEQPARFKLNHSPQTLQIWPFRFSATFEATLQPDALTMQLTISNEDDREFSFTTALHTYLRVNNIDEVVVTGLKDVRYRDSTQQGMEFNQNTESLKIRGEVDRIYMSTSQPVSVMEGSTQIQCAATGFQDTVIWNPGLALSTKLSDMSDTGFQNMLCVEAGVVATTVRLAPGAQWCGEQQLTVIKTEPG